MPGNEIEITEYLVRHKGKLSLRHVGIVTAVGAPNLSESGYAEIIRTTDVARNIASEDSRKKADIYINGHGISLKQKGSSFAFNRLQRANLLEIFGLLSFRNPESLLQRLDTEVNRFHKGELDGRNRPWEDFFSEDEFKTLLKYLMLEAGPNVGYSKHPAEFILEAPAGNITGGDIVIYQFDEYFDQNKDKLKIAIRRQWVGQDSDSEHGRALSLTRKSENLPWVFDDVVGEPRSGWRSGFPANERKTVYFLMIEKKA